MDKNDIKKGDKILIFDLPYWNGVVEPHEQIVIDTTSTMVKIKTNGLFAINTWHPKCKVEKIK